MRLITTGCFSKRYQPGPWAAALLVAGSWLGATTYATTTSAAQTVPGAPSVARTEFRNQGDLVFISKGALWDLDGTSGKLTLLAPASKQTSDGQFSPNGRWLSYSVGSGQVGLAR